MAEHTPVSGRRTGSGRGREAVGERPERAPQTGQLLEMTRAQCLEPRAAVAAEGDPHDPLIRRIGTPLHEPRGLGAIDELDDAVVPQEEQLRELSHRRGLVTGRAPDREQELVLRGREARRRRLLLAPAQEPPQLPAELEQPRVVAVGEPPRHLRIVARDGVRLAP